MNRASLIHMFTAGTGGASRNLHVADRPHAGADPDVLRTIRTVQRMPIETIATTGDETISKIARDAIAEGRDVSMVCIATQDVAITPTGFRVLARIGFEGAGALHPVLITSDAAGRIASVVDTTASMLQQGETA
jgi:hypothetical protein